MSICQKPSGMLERPRLRITMKLPTDNIEYALKCENLPKPTAILISVEVDRNTTWRKMPSEPNMSHQQ